VLSFLAAHATESFSLAELARLLKLSKGSAHRVLTALTEAGFVARHPRHKTYMLGVTMVAIGQAALERYPGIEIARREMTRLRERLGIGLGATAVVNDEYLLIAREGLPRTQDGLTIVGERRRLVPNIGIGQISWSSQSEIDAWLARGADYLDDRIRNHLRAALPVIRQRGYSMAANGSGMLRLIEASLVPSGTDSKGMPGAFPKIGEMTLNEFQLLDIAEAATTGVNYIAAPVFSPDGEVAFEIVGSDIPALASTEELETIAQSICQAANAVTAVIRGRRPVISNRD
jgi:DNA-binding IclR family transcriptional regulator